jgi:hypothetical protein
MRRSIFRGYLELFCFCVLGEKYLAWQSEEKEARSSATVVLPSLKGSVEDESN